MNRVFTPVPGSNTAVRVNSQRILDRGNGVGPIFLNMAGLNNIDVKMMSVFETYYPTCYREGFVANARIDVQSNSVFGNGFCIHSNDHVELNNGNTFMDGTIVSMPDKGDLVIPTDGFASNPGLYDALRSGSYQSRVLAQIDDIIAGVTDPDSPYFRTDYVDIDPLTNTVPAPIPLGTQGGNIDISTWVPGAVHTLDCPSPSKKYGFGKNGEVIQQGVLITNCIIAFGAGFSIEDVIIVSENTDDAAFTGGAGFTVGRDDGCLPGGGSQLITRGGMNFPADLNVYGGQLIAVKDVNFAARPDGIEGISIVAGGQIDGSSLIDVGFCGGAGMENNFVAQYFRLAT